MRILLVVKSKMMETLGPMYLSSVIKQAGHEAKIVSLSEVTLAENYEWKPDIIGFSIMTGDRDKFKQAADIIRCYSKKQPKIIVGGPDPTFFPEGYDWADEICKGEGENWISKYLTPKDEWIPSYNNIDSIPWPDRSDFPNMKVRDFITSRGCPYKCTYCYNDKWASMFPEQKGVRVRDPRDVVAEIKSVNLEYAFFQDSCFGVDINWLREFKKEYQKIGSYLEGGLWGMYMTRPLYPPYQCNLRPELVTEERVDLLKTSNCVAVRMALETASDRLREMVGRKGYNSNDIISASNILQKNNIMYMIQNIIGLPTATINEDLHTLALNIGCKPTYSWVSIYQPYCGTKLGDLCKEKGWYRGDYSDITDSFFDTSFLEISPEYKEQLEVLQKVWAMCVDYEHLPKPEELTYKALPKLIHTITRRNGDRKLYLGLL